MAKKVEKWFIPGKALNWSKLDSQTKRRRNALAARRKDYLATARALQAISNVTMDAETKRKSKSDAKYFFMKHKQSIKKKK